MKKTDYSFLQETVYEGKITKGLKYYIVPKPGFTASFFSLSVPLGSATHNYTLNNEKRTLPLGLAHFLEHQLFDGEDRDAIISQFAALGADCNAYTATFETVFTVSTSTNYEAVLNLLLDYVQTPHFSPQTIEKERGIIAQERLMYLDSVDHALGLAMMRQLYKHHPLKEDPIGTKESIQTISYQDLLNAHQTFYHPSKMTLIIVGDLNPLLMRKIIIKNQKNKVFPPALKVKTLIPRESLKVAKSFSTKEMDINSPKIVMGFKIPPLKGYKHNLLQTKVLFSILIEDMLGTSSNIYQEMLDKHIFDTGYFLEWIQEYTYGYIMLGADSTDPQRFYEYVIDLIPKLQAYQIDRETFQTKLKGLIGNILRGFNDLEAFGEVIKEKIEMKIDLFRDFSLLSRLDYPKENILSPYFKLEALSTLIVYPQNFFRKNSSKKTNKL